MHRNALNRFVLTMLAAIAILAGCSTNPSTGRRQFIVMSSGQVNAMGEASKGELITEYGGEVQSRQLREYVSSVGTKLENLTEADYPHLEWEFFVLDSDVINAFALPGGKVFMSRELLERMDSEAQLAGVLGHEVGHVTARHVDERLSQAAVLQGVAIGAAVGAGAASDSDWAQYVPLVVGAAGQGYLLKFGRDQELEADRQGIKYMTWAGYNPKAMLEVMAILADASAGGAQPEFLSTHPHPETRVEAIEEMLAGEYEYTQNNPEFKMFRRRFQEQAEPYLDMPARASTGASTWCAVCAARESVDHAIP